jgi:predicted Zn-dependent peptidase
MEDSSAQASWYAKEALFRDEIKTPEERLKVTDAVTGDDVRAIAKKIFDWGKVRVAVIGDVKKETIKF